MFIGEYVLALDEKGRMSVPAKFRSELKNQLVVTRGLDGCLFVYPKPDWEVTAKRLSELPISQKKSRAFARLMLAGAFEARPDSQGRIMLPESLRKYAALLKQAVVVGLYNRLEIWSAERWSAYKQETESRSDEIAEAMSELGV